MFEGRPEGVGNPVGMPVGRPPGGNTPDGRVPVGNTPEEKAVGPTLTVLLLFVVMAGKPDVPADRELTIGVEVVDATLVMLMLDDTEPVPMTEGVVAFILGAAEPVPVADGDDAVSVVLVPFDGNSDVLFAPGGGAPPAQNPFHAAV